MQTFLVRLDCRSPYLTPWRNCTLWGRFSWLVASGVLDGWTVEDWIARTRGGTPPLVVGDAFPYDAFPVPKRYHAEADGTRKLAMTLPWDDWLSLCATGRWPEAPPRSAVHAAERTHVVMDRTKGSSLDGGLRTEQGTQPKEGVAFVALTDEDFGRDGLEVLVQALCAEGWGYGRTTGYGHVELRSVEPLERPMAGGALYDARPSSPDRRPSGGRLLAVPGRAGAPARSQAAPGTEPVLHHDAGTGGYVRRERYLIG